MSGNGTDYFVHESSYVDDNVTIGKGTKIWHFSHILGGSVLGESCNIGQNVVIGPDVRVGSNVKIQNNVSVYSGVELKDNVFVGPSAVFTNVTTPRSEVNRKSEYAKTIVNEGATIGANSTIVCGHDLGKYCLIGAGSVVTKTVPDHQVVYGNPATAQGWACKCGQILKDDLKCPDTENCQRQYERFEDSIREI